MVLRSIALLDQAAIDNVVNLPALMDGVPGPSITTATVTSGSDH